MYCIWFKFFGCLFRWLSISNYSTSTSTIYRYTSTCRPTVVELPNTVRWRVLSLVRLETKEQKRCSREQGYCTCKGNVNIGPNGPRLFCPGHWTACGLLATTVVLFLKAKIYFYITGCPMIPLDIRFWEKGAGVIYIVMLYCYQVLFRLLLVRRYYTKICIPS